MPTREPEIDPTSPSVRLQDHFASLADPRRRKVIHPLINIVSIAVCPVVAGADDLVAIALWARERRDWLAKFLDPSAGIPSHDRFNAIFRAVDPGAFEAGLLSWIAAPARADGRPGRRPRRQDLAWQLRPGLGQGGDPHGLGLGDGQSPEPWAGDRGGQDQRDHGDPRTAAAAGA
jgi:hypothetical protein